jgi:hypothetical protein
MHDTPNDLTFISGIYNYCDRWCERCSFTDRCRVFATENESDDSDPSIDSCLQKVAESFAETKRMLIEQAEKWGIDLDALSDEEFDEIQRREKSYVEGDELSRLGDEYWRSAQLVIDDVDKLIPDLAADQELLRDALSVVSWFLFFIPVKIKSGLHGLLDENGFEDKEPVADVQSYSNGTVKTALIAIERSIGSWRKLLELGGIEQARPLIELLEEIQKALEKRFPKARDFIRPGFDEIDLVM